MSSRIEKIISIIKAYNKTPLKTNSTDIDNTIKLEYSLEIVDLLKKIDRSHGGDTLGKELLLDTLVYLEKL